MPEISNYLYRREISLNHATGDLVAYCALLLVGRTAAAAAHDVDCAGHCLENFNDLYFTEADGETPVPYWIELIDGGSPNQRAKCWLLPAGIDTEETILFLYYGYSSAVGQSNGDDVFLLFDHFDGANIDADKWDIASRSTYALTQSESMLILNPQLPAGTYGGCGLISKTNLSNMNYSVEALINKSPNGYNNGELGFAVGLSGKTTQDNTYYGNWNPTANMCLSKYGTTYSFCTYNAAYQAGITTNLFNASVRIKTEINHTTHKVNLSAVLAGNTYTNNMTPAGAAITNCYPFIHVGDRATNILNYCDWFFVRKLPAAEPTWLSFGDEESLEVPVDFLLSDVIARRVIGPIITQ